MTVVAQVRALCRRPPPAIGSGATAQRWLTLYHWARQQPVSVARLAEAHVDAAQILAEADLDPPAPGLIYGVWASEGPDPVTFDRESGTINGMKAFCSGAGIVDRVLVTARDRAGGHWLVDVATPPPGTDPTGSFLTDTAAGPSGAAGPSRAAGSSLADPAGPTWLVDGGAWATPALADTATATVRFRCHPVIRAVGRSGFYLDRAGFWHGAIGPAACWAGAAAGLVDVAETILGPGRPARPPRTPGPDGDNGTVDGTTDRPLDAVALGDLRAECHLLTALLATAGHEADRHPADLAGARYRAYALRHLVERSTARIVDRFVRAAGPRPLAGDAAVAQRLADIQLYTRQHHGDADLAILGREPAR